MTMNRFYALLACLLVAESASALADPASSLGPAAQSKTAAVPWTFSSDTFDAPVSGAKVRWSLATGTRTEQITRADGRKFVGKRAKSATGAVVFVTCPDKKALPIEKTDQFGPTSETCGDGVITALDASQAIERGNFTPAVLTKSAKAAQVLSRTSPH